MDTARRHRRGTQWAKQVKQRDGHACRQCGATTNLEAHHITPLAEGGPAYALGNGITLCVDCHPRGDRFLDRQHGDVVPGFREINSMAADHDGVLLRRGQG